MPEIHPDLTSHENWIEKTKENLDLVLNEDVMANVMEFQWSAEGSGYVSDQDRRKPERMAANAVDSYIFYLEMCVIPPPELLLTIRDMFQTYYLYKGRRSLEDVFFGESKKGLSLIHI